MPVILGLCCALALLAVAVVAIAAGRWPGLPRAVYAACLVVSVVGGGAALAQLAGGPAGGTAVVLPLGLPWLGAHFRLDALSAFFLLVVNLADALACLYALGYAADEPSRRASCPSSPPSWRA